MAWLAKPGKSSETAREGERVQALSLKDFLFKERRTDTAASRTDGQTPSLSNSKG